MCPEPLLLRLITGETGWNGCLGADAAGQSRQGIRRLIRAGNYFLRIKGLNGEVWEILLHFGGFHCLLSPKNICVQVKTPDMEGPCMQPPSGPQLLGCIPKGCP